MYMVVYDTFLLILLAIVSLKVFMSVESSPRDSRWGCWLASGCMGLVALVLLGIPFLNQSRPKHPHLRNCAGNLKQIGLALIIYAGDDPDSGFFPDSESFERLNTGRYLTSGKVYACPSATQPNTLASESNYVYLGAGLKDTNAQSTRVVMAHDRIDNHDNWVNLLYLDGHVKGIRANSWDELYRVAKEGGDIIPGRDGLEGLPSYQAGLGGAER